MLIHTLKSLLAAVGAGLLLTAAAPVRAADPGIGDNTITLGMSAPFSGPNGAYGKEMREGALAYFAHINGVGGVNGKKVELVSLDDGYEIEKTVANTRKLLEENKVFALMAYYGSSPTTEAMKLFSEAKTPLLGTISGAGSLRSPVNRYMFHLRASYADETEAIVNHLVGLGITNIAVFYQNDGFGKSGKDGVTAALARHKLKPVAEGTVERNSLQAETAVAQIAKSNPQAVIMVTLYKPTAEFIRQMRKAGQMPQFSTLSPIGADLLVGEMGAKDAHGVGISQVMPYPWNDTVPVVKEYHKALQAFAKHNRYSYYGLEGFINAKLVAEAMRKAGRDLSREKLVNILETTPFDLGGYKINYSPTSHNGSRFVDLTVLGRDGRVLR
ncbi:ABC transporter substrate-binding protein [Thauera aminoaromatica]|uniref:ABC transporter permease n=1 Tax=Thauera aminoaromatica TaxID=164330 RepID=A0A5C7S2S9_THASP|nr:ABC transporter substrate-binding protein [Thauera aminoaromatica]TXH78037.1 MAG: ABC transporter permease [Thauera aminoaromatica]